MVIARTRSRSLWIPLSYLQTSQKTSSEQKITPQEKTEENLLFHFLDVPSHHINYITPTKKQNKSEKNPLENLMSCFFRWIFLSFFLAKRRFRRPGGCIQGGCSLGWTATCAAACGAWGTRGAWGSGTWWPDESIRRRIGNPWFRCVFSNGICQYISVQFMSQNVRFSIWTNFGSQCEALCLSRLIK